MGELDEVTLSVEQVRAIADYAARCDALLNSGDLDAARGEAFQLVGFMESALRLSVRPVAVPTRSFRVSA